VTPGLHSKDGDGLMGVRRYFSRVEQHRHFAYLFQVADDALQMDFSLYTPQRKCPMLRQESQKCASLSAMARCIAIIYTKGYLQIFKEGHFFFKKHCHAFAKPQIMT